MKFLSSLLKSKKHAIPKTIAEYKQEMMERIAREQFEKLSERGLTVPIALL